MARTSERLGQHFLRDHRVLRKVLQAASLEERDHVVEIGAGTGTLTIELLKIAGHVTAIEIDRRLVPLLQANVAKSCEGTLIEKLTVIRGDALTTPFPKTPYKIVANIPYQITSPLLRKVFLEEEQRPLSLTLLIQKEVAEKLCGHRGCSRLSVLTELFGTPRLIASVPPSAFSPNPHVTSAIIHINCSAPLADRGTTEEVLLLAERAFQGKRKMLRGTIGKLEGGVERLHRAAIDPKRRPETLAISEWLNLAHTR